MLFPFSPSRNFSVTNLIARRASGLDSLGVMPSAEELPVLVEIDEVHQKLFADVAHKTPWMPQVVGSGSGCRHTDIPTAHLIWTLKEIRQIRMFFS